jgi:hypothetical protein
VLPLVLAAGCRNCDLVEAELRTRCNEVRELREQLHRVEAQNQALLQDLGALRHGPLASPPEVASQANALRRIRLGFGTGGTCGDHSPGDDALRIILETRDSDDQIVKAPGALEVHALEISPEGLKHPLSSWDIPADHLRNKWQTGIITGYNVLLPWKTWPTSEKLRVVARFTLPDGRRFETDKDIIICLPTEAERLRHPPAPRRDEGPPLPETDADQPLPLPRKVPAQSQGKKPTLWGRSAEPEEVLSATYEKPVLPPPSLSQMVHLLTPEVDRDHD